MCGAGLCAVRGARAVWGGVAYLELREHGAIHHGHLGHRERVDQAWKGYKRTVSARVVRGSASNARRYARRRLSTERPAEPLQSNRAPGSEGSWPIAWGRSKGWGTGGQRQACAGEGGRANFCGLTCFTQRPSDHQDQNETLAHRRFALSDDRGAGAVRGRRVTFARGVCVRVRARKACACARARARGETLWSGPTAHTQGSSIGQVGR